MKLDTKREGLKAIFKDWQIPLVEELSRRTLTSREAYDFIVEHDIRTFSKMRGPVSRAGIIGFLNSLVDEGLLSYTEKTKRGGYYRIYKVKMNREELGHMILGRFVNKLLEVFPEESLTFTWPRPEKVRKG